jgi:hypothetical protein
MLDENVIKYISDARSKGISDEQIKQHFRASGWSEEQMAPYFSVSQPPAPPPQIPQYPQAQATTISSVAPGEPLPPFGKIFSAVRAEFKRKFWVYMGLAVMPVLFSLLVSLVLPDVPIIPGILNGLVSSIFGFALVCAIIQNNNFGGSIAYAFKKIFTYWWVGFLMFLVIIGGFVMLIIPGLVFLCMTSLSIFVLATEEKKGFDALVRSREYYKGYGAVAFSYIFLNAIILMISATLAAIGLGGLSTILAILLPVGGGMAMMGGLVGMPLLMAGFSAFAIIFMGTIFKELSARKPELKSAPTIQSKTLFKVSAILGIIAPIVIISYAIMSAGGLSNLIKSEATLEARDFQRISDMNAIKTAMNLYIIEGKTLTCEEGEGYSSEDGTKATDGTGWIPVDLTSLPGGSPLPFYPVDPINEYNPLEGPRSVYTFTCNPVNNTFKLTTVFESLKYRVKMDEDGGTDMDAYEVSNGKMSDEGESNPLDSEIPVDESLKGTTNTPSVGISTEITTPKERDATRKSNLDMLNMAIASLDVNEHSDWLNQCSPDRVTDSKTGLTTTDGTGWVPLDFPPPIMPKGLPVDPLNSGDYYYTFTCDAKSGVFELTAKLEAEPGFYKVGRGAAWQF